MRRQAPVAAVLGLAIAGLATPGCSIRQIAINKVGDALAGTGTSFAGDEDSELIGDAVPFGLKMMESLLEQSPRHKGLLLAAAGGFVQYAWGWVVLQADQLESVDLARSTEQRERARKLYLRARDYGLRGLELDLPGLKAALAGDPKPVLARARKEHVPLLYWTAVGWAGALSLRVNDPELTTDQATIEALARRALELDEGWGLGSIHEFFIRWEASHASVGGSLERAREHYRKTLAFAQGKRALPYVTYAESVLVSSQDKAGFQELMQQAMAVDVSRPTEDRLANLLAQRRARWQLGRLDELFIE